MGDLLLMFFVALAIKGAWHAGGELYGLASDAALAWRCRRWRKAQKRLKATD